MITRLKNQIEFLIGDIKSITTRADYRRRLKIIINSVMSDSELEFSLKELLNELERRKKYE